MAFINFTAGPIVVLPNLRPFVSKLSSIPVLIDDAVNYTDAEKNRIGEIVTRLASLDEYVSGSDVIFDLENIAVLSVDPNELYNPTRETVLLLFESICDTSGYPYKDEVMDGVNDLYTILTQ
jgi:hypothetical protein